MKFRHKSNFNEIDLDEILETLITNHWTRESQMNTYNLSKLLAGTLLKEDVESILERFDYVKVESAN